MPQWIHQRAQHLMRKNPSMPESMAWGLATQQSHATGHTPKSYGTKEGRQVAKKKYDEPKKDYVQTADPKTKTSAVALYQGFSDEMKKIAAVAGPTSAVKAMGKTPTLQLAPKPVSKVSPAMPSSGTDTLSAVRTTPPPPTTF